MVKGLLIDGSLHWYIPVCLFLTSQLFLFVAGGDLVSSYRKHPFHVHDFPLHVCAVN